MQAGTYTNDFSTITTKISIIGVGGLAHLVATQSPPNGKAILTTDTDVKIDHLEFSGAAVSDMNGAGIRYESGALSVTNSYFHDNQDGILGNAAATGSIVIDRSEFNHNGAGDGSSHNLYIGHIPTLQIANSYIHDAVVGHEIKSRADSSTIVNNRIVDGNGSASYSIDLPNGGNGTIQNNIIQQGPNSQNPAIIAYSEESAPLAGSQLNISGNTIINQKGGSALGVSNNATTVQAQITGNHIYGLTAAQIASGPNVQSGNDTLAAAPAIDTSHPWANSPWDDIVWGGAATNLLRGTAGHNLFVGGAGNDTFVIQSGGNSDTIAAFDGAHDVVQLNGYGLNSFSAVSAAMSQQGSDAVLTLGNGETLTFQGMQTSAFAADDFSFSGSPPPAKKLAYDFDGDGRADLLLQNDSGQAAIWLMNGGTVLASGSVGTADPSWHVKGAGDFNGDGKADVLLQNDAGQAAIWLMNGLSLVTNAPADPNQGSAWHVKGAGDFNGDGKSDILWQNDNGTPAIGLMNGTSLVSWVAGANSGPSWHIKGAGDFNGDGKADILWQNDNGQAVIYLMNGTTILSGGPLAANPGAAWHIKGAEDLNGDGKADVILQNDNGQIADWLMNGTTVLETDTLATNPGPTWHVDWA